MPGSLKHPPPHPWKLSTYAKKATVSVLYWYEKLSGQMTDNLWKRPRKGPIFFCPFRPWVCGARPWATVFPPFFCRAQTAAKTRFHRFARVPASFGANKARFTHSASAPTSPIGSRRDPTVRCGPTTQRTDAIQAPFFTLFVPFFRAPPPTVGRRSVVLAGAPYPTPKTPTLGHDFSRSWVRPHLAESTTSRPICEVKQPQAALVLRSVMTWEPAVSYSKKHFFF